MPNKYNIFIYCFAAFGLIFALFIIGELTGGHTQFQRDLLYSTSILTFLFGVITLFTKPKRFKIAQREAHKRAINLLEKIDEHGLCDNNHAVARLIDIVQKTNSPGFGEDDINKLYDLVPACFLPLYYRDQRCILDWHRFDLCIISSDQDMELARRIVNMLHEHHRELRIFVDDEYGQVIDRQEKRIERNYYAGSRLCLALISGSLMYDSRRKVQLNYARQREEKVSKNRQIILSGNAAYLKPIPLDEPGFLFMKKARDLSPFVEHFPLIQDRNHLLRVVVNSILEELRKFSDVPLNHPAGKGPSSDISGRVLISHSGKDVVFARRLYDDLRARSVNCWFDPEDLKIGAPIRDDIEDALRLHGKLLVILSENAIKSPWVQNEVELAFEKERDSGKIIVFHIKIDNSVDTARPAWARTLWRQRKIGDFTAWENTDAYLRALEHLVLALRSEKESG